MIITWYGQSLFEICAKDKNSNKITIVIDPFDEKIGLKVKRLKADILLITHYHFDHSNIKSIRKDYFLIDGPGEYEIRGIFIKGISAYHDEYRGEKRGGVTIYTIKAEDLSICHLSDFGQNELNPEQLEELLNIDILLIPVGGVYTINSKSASKIINQIEPKIVIPMHYQIEKLNLKLDSLNEFLSVLGIERKEVLDKLNIKKTDLPASTKIIVLNPNI